MGLGLSDIRFLVEGLMPQAWGSGILGRQGTRYADSVRNSNMEVWAQHYEDWLLDFQELLQKRIRKRKGGQT